MDSNIGAATIKRKNGVPHTKEYTTVGKGQRSSTLIIITKKKVRKLLIFV